MEKEADEEVSADACAGVSDVFEEAVFIIVTLSYCGAPYKKQQQRGAELLPFNASRLDVLEWISATNYQASSNHGATFQCAPYAAVHRRVQITPVQ